MYNRDMKKIYLASSINFVAAKIAVELDLSITKRFAFITTASEVVEGDLTWLKDDRQALLDSGFEVVDYTLTGKNTEQISQDFDGFDGIVMEGGNTFYLLKKIQECNCAAIITNFVEKGRPYIGSSAGSIVAGPDIYPAYCKEDAEQVPDLKDFTGLNLTDIIIQPHWGSPIFKESYLTDTMEKAYTPDYKMVLLSNYQYINIVDGGYRIIDIRTDK
jgi:dipeptidase E